MTTTLDAHESRGIEVLRWPLIVLVVFIHANNERIGLPAPAAGSWRVTHLIRQFLSEGVAATAVPLFFMIAGRLYFRGPRFDRSAYGTKVRSRVRTLALPYVLWNLAVAGAFLVATKVPTLAAMASGKQAEALSGSPLQVFAAVFGIGQDPIAYPFWFLRDLIVVVVLLTPLFALAYRTAPWAVALLLGVPWLLHLWPIESFSVVGPLFFFLGGWAGWRERSIVPQRGSLAILLPLWIALIAIDFLGYAGDLFPYVRQLSIAVGVCAMLALASAAARREGLRRRLAAAAPYAFFLYAAHEPLLTVLRRLGGKALSPPSPGTDLVIYFVSVLATVGVATAGQRILSRLAPRPFALLTGGR